MTDDKAQGTGNGNDEQVNELKVQLQRMGMQLGHAQTVVEGMQNHIDQQALTIQSLTDTLRLLITQQAKPKPAPRVRKRKAAAAKDRSDGNT